MTSTVLEPPSGLSHHVLILNRDYMAIRITTARRAFSLLYRNLAEVVHVEDDNFLSYDFDSWRELSEYRSRYAAPHRFQEISSREPAQGGHFLALPRLM